jgi:FkbM family methyltransferase
MKRGGYFVDIGACYPFKLSNTSYLESKWDWTGLLIEPNPTLASQLQTYRTSKVLNLAVGQPSQIDLSISTNPEYSSVLAQNRKKHNLYESTGEILSVSCKTLQCILGENNVPRYFDYLSIDVEGMEMDVLESGDWEKWRPNFISIEHNFTNTRHNIKLFLEKVGYERDDSFSVFSWDDFYIRIR